MKLTIAVLGLGAAIVIAVALTFHSTAPRIQLRVAPVDDGLVECRTAADCLDTPPPPPDWALGTPWPTMTGPGYTRP